jgi:hypothetical protein
MDKIIGKWAPGASCAFASSINHSEHFRKNTQIDGPVLSQTDLYLLNTELEINPILEGKGPNQLQFHLVTGLHR